MTRGKGLQIEMQQQFVGKMHVPLTKRNQYRVSRQAIMSLQPPQKDTEKLAIHKRHNENPNCGTNHQN